MHYFKVNIYNIIYNKYLIINIYLFRGYAKIKQKTIVYLGRVFHVRYISNFVLKM